MVIGGTEGQLTNSTDQTMAAKAKAWLLKLTGCLLLNLKEFEYDI